MTTQHKTPTADDIAAIYRACPVAQGNSHDIRVLEILPSMACGLDTIECRMQVVPINTAMKYAAVSYVWGDPDVIEIILVNGFSLPARMNIWNFLWQLRSEGYMGMIWIDAICINQQDTPERSHQVGLMGLIYSRATKVFVWLGTGGEDETLIRALLLLDTLDYRHGVFRDTYSWTITQWRLVSLIFRAEYWSRLWIVQEFLLPKSLEIRCGRVRVEIDALLSLEHSVRHLLHSRLVKAESSWQNFGYAASLHHDAHGTSQQEIMRDRTSSHSDDPRTGTDANTDSIRKLYGAQLPFTEILLDIKDGIAMGLVSQRQRRSCRTRDETWDDAFLIDTICYYSNANCFDPRDHVYALLALADSSTSISPDYSKSASEIFQDVFGILKRLHDVRRQKIRILEPLRIIGFALSLTADDPTVRKVFEEIGAECFLGDGDEAEFSGA